MAPHVGSSFNPITLWSGHPDCEICPCVQQSSRIPKITLRSSSAVIDCVWAHCFVVDEHGNWLSVLEQNRYWAFLKQRSGQGLCPLADFKDAAPEFKCPVLCVQCPADRYHEGQPGTIHRILGKTFALNKSNRHYIAISRDISMNVWTFTALFKVAKCWRSELHGWK